MPIKKRSKEERTKSAQKVRKAIYTTTPSHGKPGSWGKEPGTFEEEALEPELEIVAVVEEEAIPETIKEVLEETAVEAEPEPIIEETVTEEVVEPIVEEVVPEPEETPKVDNTAEIAALRAKLAELEK